MRGSPEESSGQIDATQGNDGTGEKVDGPMLPAGDDGEHTEGQNRKHPEEPFRTLDGKEPNDGDGCHDVTAGDDVNGIVDGDQFAVDLILPTVWRGRSGHFGRVEIPDARNREK